MSAFPASLLSLPSCIFLLGGNGAHSRNTKFGLELSPRIRFTRLLPTHCGCGGFSIKFYIVGVKSIWLTDLGKRIEHCCTGLPTRDGTPTGFCNMTSLPSRT